MAKKYTYTTAYERDAAQAALVTRMNDFMQPSDVGCLWSVMFGTLGSRYCREEGDARFYLVVPTGGYSRLDIYYSVKRKGYFLIDAMSIVKEFAGLGDAVMQFDVGPYATLKQAATAWMVLTHSGVEA